MTAKLRADEHGDPVEHVNVIPYAWEKDDGD